MSATPIFHVEYTATVPEKIDIDVQFREFVPDSLLTYLAPMIAPWFRQLERSAIDGPEALDRLGACIHGVLVDLVHEGALWIHGGRWHFRPPVSEEPAAPPR
jgi:hypothetical protein